MRGNKVSRSMLARAMQLATCAFAIATVVCFPRPTAAQEGPMLRFVRSPEEISLTLTLLTKDGTITAGEPLLARTAVRNETNASLEVWASNSASRAMQFEVRDEEGRVVASTPKPRIHVEGLQGIYSLNPGQTRTGNWVITGLCQFTNPRVYEVRVTLWDFSGNQPKLAEDSCVVRVLPYDPKRLEERCDELFRPISSHGPYGNLPWTARVTALYSVRNEVVLPYLDWMAREWSDGDACLAMLRLGTERAKKLLDSLAARHGEVGLAARRAKRMVLQPANVMWDMSGD